MYLLDDNFVGLCISFLVPRCTTQWPCDARGITIAVIFTIAVICILIEIKSWNERTKQHIGKPSGKTQMVGLAIRRVSLVFFCLGFGYV